MRTFLVLIIVFFHCSFITQSNAQDIFKQDVAIIHGSKQGLPDVPIDKITISNNIPTVITSEENYSWNGDQWLKSDGAKQSRLFSKFKNLPDGSGKILSEVTYKGDTYIGCENGMFIQTRKNKWQQVFPADKNYSWALKKVAALVVDSEGHLWFGSKEGIGKNTNGTWQLFTGKEGVPYSKFT